MLEGRSECFAPVLFTHANRFTASFHDRDRLYSSEDNLVKESGGREGW